MTPVSFKTYFAISVLLLSASSIIQNNAFEDNPDSFDILAFAEISLSSYDLKIGPTDRLLIMGTIEGDFQSFHPIKLVVYDPSGNIVYQPDVAIDGDGTFKYLITAPLPKFNDGIHTVEASHEDLEEKTQLYFTVSSNTSEEMFGPSWIKNMALWFGEDLISEQEYLDSIKFLIENNIITIDKIKDRVVIDPIILTLEESFNDPRITQCNILHSSYISQDYTQFQEQYSHINYLYDCVDLYNDKVWHYQGEDRQERMYHKFIEIHKQNLALPSQIPTELYTKVRSIDNMGTEAFMIQFDVCAGDAFLDKAKVLVKSDMETILVVSDKDIPPISCRNYETQIYATHSDHIELEIIEKVLVRNK